MKTRCLIVDDEPLAQRVLEKYITSLPSLELVEKCSNALEATALLHEKSIDVMFLDIKMPELTGLDFLRTLTNPPYVILTTAYSEYALDGYEFSVVDYLLKPIAFDRFLKAINKVTALLAPSNETPSPKDQTSTNEFIFLREDKVDHKVLLSAIHYIEGCGNFVKVFTRPKMFLVTDTLTNFENLLPQNRFIRIHKSYIIALDKIDQIIGNMVTLGGKNIPIGNYYRKHAGEVFKKYQINKQ